MWSEFRQWRLSQPEASRREAGTKACEALLKYFGPYDIRTAEVLEAKRKVHREREKLLRKLDDEFPASLRSAAREYLGPQVSLVLNLPPLPSVLGVGSPYLTEPPQNPLQREANFETEFLGSMSKAEQVLRDYMVTASNRQPLTTLQELAKDIVDRIKPLESQLDVLDIQESLTRLPSIPGELEPADIDRIPFGFLICRHRAVVVGILLADAGFELEVVRGAVEQEGRRGEHLFIYAEGDGILEASSDGPDFWKEVASSSENDGKLAARVKGGSTYRFEHRTPLTKPIASPSLP